MLDVLIIGTGSLARATCYALSSIPDVALKICLVGRNLSYAQDIVAISNARVCCLGGYSTFVADCMYWDKEAIGNLLDTYAPTVIFLAASLQSAWEFQEGHSMWADVVRQTSYAVTIALQSYLPSKIATVIKEKGLPTFFVNACYPDAVNALLHANRLDVLCGIGNIGIIHMGLKNFYKGDMRSGLKLLAHHFHLTKSPQNFHGDEQPKVWIDNNELSDNSDWISPIVFVKRVELNQLTGCLAAKFLKDFLGQETFLHHVPGPMGLLGGYPVLVGQRKVTLSLPDTMTYERAVSLNTLWAVLDGVTVEDTGFVRFSHNVKEVLFSCGNRYAEGFESENLDEVGEYFISFRKKLQGGIEHAIQ